MSVDTIQKTTELDILQSVQDRESLFAFLRDELRWNVDPEDTFTYSAPALSDDIAAQVEVSQIIPFSAADPFVIMLAEFSTPFRRSSLREILRAIKNDMRRRARYEGKSLEDIVFVCATEDYRGIRFAHFQEQGTRQPRLSVFGWDMDNTDETRTLREFNLPALKMQFNVLGEPDWQIIKESWLSAWDVERVTDGFFKAYNKVFCDVEDMIGEVTGNKRLFTQRLFNRLLFIQFIQKKKWLHFEGSTNYLPTLFQAAKSNGENFYDDRLHWLFFHGLGTPISDSEPTYADHEDLVISKRGTVPFLNGGLFEIDDEDDQRGNVSIPNEVFDRIINDLFAQYNFTVTESTPLDIEVAVDPEMLGKIFEELVTGRHESGSYYTPKPIVSFMCREALKGYIRERVPGVSEEAASKFVDEHDPQGIKNPEQVLEALRRVKVCDPACGSGAYLLGMLRELLDLRACLFSVKQVDAESIYDRKLEIIQKNLYGVDKDVFAVNVARLRLWLSLVVEYEGAGDPPPLPNLDFKIECGDSVVCPNPQGNPNQGFRDQLIRQFVEKKGAFLRAHNEEKHTLLNEIKEIRKDIAELEGRQGVEIPFDWSVDFAEVFSWIEPISSIGGGFNFGYELAEQPEPGGFDIVVANPPYVKQQLIKDIKPTLKGVYGDCYDGTADLYVFFYYRAIQLLRQGGMFAFISSNKWFKANYGTKLREHIAASCAIKSMTDFGELPVFQTAATFPMIFVAQKSSPNPTPVFTQVKSLDYPYPDVLSLVRTCGQALPAGAISGANWLLADSDAALFLKKMESSGIPLGEFVKGRIYRGVLTGFNEAFVIDGAKRAELIAQDPQSEQIIKPLAVGDDIRKWRIEDRDRWLIFTRKGINIDDYPAIKAHLSQWALQLEPRKTTTADADSKIGRKPGNYKWFEIQDKIDYYQEFDKPKIVYGQFQLSPHFAVSLSTQYFGSNQYMLVVEDTQELFYVCGILNSSWYFDYMKKMAGVLGDADDRGRLVAQKSHILGFPVALGSDTDKTAISCLVQKCLDAKGVDCKQWEKEIDERVAALYGL